MSKNKNNYITPSGFKRLQEEINQLLLKERPEVIKLIQWAASNGDRSENADYLYGRKRLREIDRRLRFLHSRIDIATIINPKDIQSIKVQFGAKVNLKDENDCHKTFTIVGTDEVDTSKGYISWQSPIGTALLGKEEGDQILVKTPSGDLEFEILKIEYLEIVF